MPHPNLKFYFNPAGYFGGATCIKVYKGQLKQSGTMGLR